MASTVTSHDKTKADLAQAVFVRQDELWRGYIIALTGIGVTDPASLIATAKQRARDYLND